METKNAYAGNVWKTRAISALVIFTLVFGMMLAAAAASPVSAAAKKYKVTLTINMGKQGCTCPLLTLRKGSKKTYGQAVSKWYVDGKVVKNFDPWEKNESWWPKHNIKVVMSVKVVKGKYKITLDNGKKVKTLYKSLKVKKAVKKKVKF